MKTMTEQVRDCIRRASRNGLTVYRLSTLTTVSQPMLSMFLSGQRGLSVEALDSLGKVLGIKLVMDAPKVRRLAKGQRKRNSKGFKNAPRKPAGKPEGIEPTQNPTEAHNGPSEAQGE